jgi:hypothetical protein
MLIASASFGQFDDMLARCATSRELVLKPEERC